MATPASSLDEGAWGSIGAIALICLPTAWYVLRPRKPIASHVHVGYLCRRLFRSDRYQLKDVAPGGHR